MKFGAPPKLRGCSGGGCRGFLSQDPRTFHLAGPEGESLRRPMAGGGMAFLSPGCHEGSLVRGRYLICCCFFSEDQGGWDFDDLM